MLLPDTMLTGLSFILFIGDFEKDAQNLPRVLLPYGYTYWTLNASVMRT
jgi:hypothetical protein